MCSVPVQDVAVQDPRRLGRSQQEKRRRQAATTLGDAAAIAACLADVRFLPPPQHRLRLDFATGDTDLRNIVLDMFHTSTAGAALEAFSGDAERALTLLHTLVPRTSESHRPATHCPFTKAYKRVCDALQNPKSAAQADVQLAARYAAALHRFARNVLAPLLGVSADDVLYQAVPVLRVSFPNALKATGVLHDDYTSNHHQPAELNFWVPLNTCFGANTLFIESAPGVGDFAPIELDHGAAVRFWGNQVRHHTVPNTTAATRVSLDLRAMARRNFNADFFDRRGRPGERRVGQFYRDSKTG
ncbi:hypothetical protein M885DRAFT_524372 [Pelagophyceae sp. CCMP2097]|nr:hypothetical protein M885DRAFT_524372 [Pelagophyceae sp. CCMP2097]|mmetsp:Transcript_6549/g.21113  ORF Transcript_6549/g.21113 Transcript_6549/m.21113 type:complete len:301 (+) Transcript_6549:141-1043(+)